jgi:serine/threonine protein kinase
MTQNADLTQLGEDLEDDTTMWSPLPPYSPSAFLKVPWGRLMPCGNHLASGGIDLLPRAPTSSLSQHGKISVSPKSTTSATTSPLQAWDHIHPADQFNLYIAGRSNKCDIFPVPPEDLDERNLALKTWAFGMISNKHCKIYCTLDTAMTSAVEGGPGSILSPAMQVYIEDTSGNGTYINKTTLLRKGEKRLLHSGDEISLVNPEVLAKKIRSTTPISELLQQFSYIFINLASQQPHAFRTLIHSKARNTLLTTPLLFSESIDHQNQLSQPSQGENAIVVDCSNKGSRARVGISAVNVRAVKHPSCHPPPLSVAQTGFPLTETKAEPDPCRLTNIKQHLDMAPPPSRRTNSTGRKRTSLIEESSTKPRRISPRRQSTVRRRIEEDYDIRDHLGSGTMGEVRRAIHRQTGQIRAVKIISTQCRNHFPSQLGGVKNDNDNQKLEAEATILQALSHPYVVKLLDVYIAPTTIYLVMELMHGGDLFDRIIERGFFSETMARRVMRRLFSAVYHLHEECSIVHRDLKPENVLLVSREDDIEVKLTDFGLAKVVNGVDDSLKTFCGTPQYFAPEVLRRRHTVVGLGRYGKQADMWSLGVILYVLLSGSAPFESPLDNETADDSSTALSSVSNIYFPVDHWKNVSTSAQSLIRELLVIDPRRRLTISAACKHEWIMIHDGDTHVYPLEDPKLTVANSCLSSQLHFTTGSCEVLGVAKAILSTRNDALEESENSDTVRGSDFQIIPPRSPLSPLQINCKSEPALCKQNQSSMITATRAKNNQVSGSKVDGVVRSETFVQPNKNSDCLEIDEDIVSRFTDSTESITSIFSDEVHARVQDISDKPSTAVAETTSTTPLAKPRKHAIASASESNTRKGKRKKVEPVDDQSYFRLAKKVVGTSRLAKQNSKTRSLKDAEASPLRNFSRKLRKQDQESEQPVCASKSKQTTLATWFKTPK